VAKSGPIYRIEPGPETPVRAKPAQRPFNLLKWLVHTARRQATARHNSPHTLSGSRGSESSAALRLSSIIMISGLAGWMIVQKSPLSISLAVLIMAALTLLVSLWI
jgi:hypothetical protein